MPSRLRAKIHFKSAVPMVFCLPSRFLYGQRSKCADLLKSYITILYIEERKEQCYTEMISKSAGSAGKKTGEEEGNRSGSAG